ncbi:MAG: hypothetical protein WAL02_17480, partial [Rhodoplanes sp.]
FADECQSFLDNVMAGLGRIGACNDPTADPADSTVSIAPDYESGGQEFESLRARHFAFDINHSRGSGCAAKSAQQIGRVYVVFFAERLRFKAQEEESRRRK